LRTFLRKLFKATVTCLRTCSSPSSLKPARSSLAPSGSSVQLRVDYFDALLVADVVDVYKLAVNHL